MFAEDGARLQGRGRGIFRPVGGCGRGLATKGTCCVKGELNPLFLRG